MSHWLVLVEQYWGVTITMQEKKKKDHAYVELMALFKNKFHAVYSIVDGQEKTFILLL